MNDLIYRQAAIDAANDWLLDCDCLNVQKQTRSCGLIRRFEDLSSAQKTGKWLEDKTGCVYWICSCCGFPSEASCANIFYRFCPRCGARMEGVE